MGWEHPLLSANSQPTPSPGAYTTVPQPHRTGNHKLATLLPVAPDAHCSLAPGHRDPCKRATKPGPQHHHVCARTSPQPSMAYSNVMGFPRASLPVPLLGQDSAPDSLPDRKAAAHTPPGTGPLVPLRLPSDLLFTLAEASSGSHSLLPALPLPSDHQGPDSTLSIPSGPLSLGKLESTQLPAKPKWQGKERSPQL